MSQAFLHGLYQTSNILHSVGKHCSICCEEYGILSRETGNIEVEMRLPCNHSVGSACIATWLKENNTCPFCRREFFAAEPRPYLEHGIMDVHDSNDADDRDRDVENMIHDFSGLLDLRPGAATVADELLHRIEEAGLVGEDHTDECLVSVCLYIASHFTDDPRSAEAIRDISGVEADHIREIYDIVYAAREQLPHIDELPPFGSLIEPGTLRWPAAGYNVTDVQTENCYT